MSVRLKNFIGIFFILHGLGYGIMLIPFPDMSGSGIGKFWRGLAGSKLLSSFNVSDYWLRLSTVIISLIALIGFIIAGSTILAAGIPTKFFLIITIFLQVFLLFF